jgi:hypothetical protein
MDCAVAAPLIPITVYMRAVRSQIKFLAGEARIVRANRSGRDAGARWRANEFMAQPGHKYYYEDLDYSQKKPRV